MKHLLAVTALSAAFFAGCVHSQPKTASVAPKDPELAAFMKKLEASMPALCLGYPMHAYESLSGEFTLEDQRKSDFRNYGYAFEDAQGVKEYIDCLSKAPEGEDYKKNYANAARSLKEAEATRDRYAAALPPGKRIVSVKRSFTDVDAKHGRARTEVTQKDGTVTADESVFEKLDLH